MKEEIIMQLTQRVERRHTAITGKTARGAESLGALMQRIRQDGLILSNTSSTNSPIPARDNPTSRAITLMKKQFGSDPKQLMTVFNPSMQIQVCRNREQAHFGTAPRLRTVAEGYGESVAETWLEVHLNNLSEWVGNREKLTKEKTDELAAMILYNYPHFRLTEFMLFFQRFKSGRYGKFFGAVDPVMIMQSLRQFADERNEIVARHREEEQRIERATRETARDRAYRRYYERVPHAGTPEAAMIFLQYQLLGYDAMDDEQLAAELKAIAGGKIVLPADFEGIMALRKQKQREGIIERYIDPQPRRSSDTALTQSR